MHKTDQKQYSRGTLSKETIADNFTQMSLNLQIAQEIKAFLIQKNEATYLLSNELVLPSSFFSLLFRSSEFHLAVHQDV